MKIKSSLPSMLRNSVNSFQIESLGASFSVNSTFFQEVKVKAEGTLPLFPFGHLIFENNTINSCSYKVTRFHSVAYAKNRMDPRNYCEYIFENNRNTYTGKRNPGIPAGFVTKFYKVDMDYRCVFLKNIEVEDQSKIFKTLKKNEGRNQLRFVLKNIVELKSDEAWSVLSVDKGDCERFTDKDIEAIN
ncbi:MAG: hypothetical protein HOD85_21675 [Deltaproteobacteria bacterium]|nr:hypothetical protein [Deltaproteobacteria bacterium]MBT4638828.1 hypothetical protein [Deltaproteobacteria bacterium]